MNKFASFYLTKLAEATYGGNNVQVQQFNPIAAKRQLSPDEQMDIEQQKQKLIPKLFASNADPISSQLSSTTVPTVGGAAVGGAIGGLLGGAIAPGSALALALGAGGGALTGGLIGHHSKKQINNNLIDQISRLPQGQTNMRDLYSDPAYQSELNRRATNNQSSALLAAAMAMRNRR